MVLVTNSTRHVFSLSVKQISVPVDEEIDAIPLDL